MGERPVVLDWDGGMPIRVTSFQRDDGPNAKFSVPEPSVVSAHITDRAEGYEAMNRIP